MIPLYVNGQQKILIYTCPWSPQSRHLSKISPPPQSPHLSKWPHLNLLSCPKWPPSMSSFAQSDLPPSRHLEKIWSPNPSQIPSIALTIYRAALSSAISSPWENVVPISPSIEKSEKMWISWTKLKKLKKIEKNLQKFEKVEKSEKLWKKLINVEKSWKV